MRTVTMSEWFGILKSQGVPRVHLAFRCCMCGHIQSMASMVAAGVPEDKVEGVVNFSCIGRWTNGGAPRKTKDGKGCNWTLGGLLRCHELEIVDEDGNRHPSFELASKEDAVALMNKMRETPEQIERHGG